MDFCRNVSVSGGMPSDYPPEQVLPPPCSKLGGGLTGSLDDLFSGQHTEVDVSLEWLSVFVEDCFSSRGHCLPAAAAAAAAAAAEVPTNVEKKTSATTPKPSKRLHLQKPQENHYPTTTPLLQKFVFPSKARSKRRRTTTTVNNKAISWAHQLKPQSHHHHSLQLSTCSSDPPLLQQAYWLADSELILPPKKEDNCNLLPVRDDGEEGETKEEITFGGVEEIEEKKEMVMEVGILEGNNNGGQARRCTHCLSQKTPQWRAGPLGPKTLCNACGVRYKSGRLLPEYRPAKSPTFVSYLHSNSHKKVLEMRMGGVLSPIPSPDQ